METWVTVFIAYDEVDAQLKKGFLDEAGIPCLIEPLNVSPYPFLSEFRIKVLIGYREQAEEILNREIG